MLMDLTLKITPRMAQDAQGNDRRALVGHLGTHFDVMNREFPLEFVKRRGIVFDVSAVRERDIESKDIDMNRVERDMFVMFRTGYLEQTGYGTKEYFSGHPQLSDELIDRLLERQVSMIGIDCAGVRRGREHTPKDQYCADRGVFIVENLWGLEQVVKMGGEAMIYTFPMNYSEITGLPCRVVAEAEE